MIDTVHREPIFRAIARVRGDGGEGHVWGRLPADATSTTTTTESEGPTPFESRPWAAQIATRERLSWTVASLSHDDGAAI
jgi:hypothetical protein